MQRVVAGHLKGRKLGRLPGGVEGLRPSSSRVRGAIFDRLQGETTGARVLDLFAGSGALSVEAISRGAAGATLVERASKVQRFLKAQLNDLGITEHCTVINSDAISWLAKAPTHTFSMVFVDPPYAQVELYAQALQALVARRWLAPDAVVVVERERRATDLGPWPVDLVQEAERRHGDCVLHFLRYAPPAADSATA